MLIAIIILSILLTAAIVTSLYYKYKYYQYMDQLINDYQNEPHVCNYCKTSYLFTRKERIQTVCDKCGRPLTLIFNHPNYMPPDDGEPFEEFKSK